MQKRYGVQVKWALEQTEAALAPLAAKAMGIAPGQIEAVEITKQSIDARKGGVCFQVALAVSVRRGVKARPDWKPIEEKKAPAFALGTKRMQNSPVVIGAGPCGLFAALMLARQGYAPVVLERGSALAQRQRTVQTFFDGGAFDPQCNVLFGDGGAGAFSDGKLTSRGKDPLGRLVLETLAQHGAPQEILIQNKAHIGTDRLRPVIESIKREVLQKGGAWYNDTRAVEFVYREGAVAAVKALHNGQLIELPACCVVLAIGHSARDTYERLALDGVEMVFKPFAVGVRIEHPQAMIDQAQYGRYAGHPKLGAAEYALTAQSGGRGVYTFCMCPGGQVIPSVSEEGLLCVNGMSQHARDGENANSAVVVQVRQEDVPGGLLGGLAFQREMERAAFAAGGGGYAAPIQTFGDFAAGKRTRKLGGVLPSYPRQTQGSDLSAVLPGFVAQGIKEGVASFGRRLKGFDRPDALLCGVETRTSAPLRILRGEDGQSPSVRGLYPAGEGAGYAGGIVSAAVDGIRAASHIMAEYAPIL